MEDLMELVAASFVRLGIECPADGSTAVGPAGSPIEVLPVPANSQVDPAALPEHSYRKKPEPGLAT
jgi:hypothetical protein